MGNLKKDCLCSIGQIVSEVFGEAFSKKLRKTPPFSGPVGNYAFFKHLHMIQSLYGSLRTD
ncbi:hypothetical protein, partial [Gluconacetobacter entanii]